MHNISIYDDVRIHAPDGTVWDFSAREIVENAKGLPLLEPAQVEFPSCPNKECSTGWAPDLLISGEWQCPKCKTIW